MSFKDHFSGHAADYAAARPSYPPALAAILARHAGGRALALDCGCGSGQLSVLLAAHFHRVVATDASAEQIAHAIAHQGVTYRVAPAERSGLDDQSVDLVVAAQAAHWFDLPAFWREVARVARPGALAALVSYGSITVSPNLDPLLRHFHDETLRDYWPAERWLVTNGYRDVLFPLDEIALPEIAMTLDWTFGQMLAYLATWSGVKAADRALGTSVLAGIAPALERAWGDPQTRRTISWPLSIRAGRVDVAAIVANT